VRLKTPPALTTATTKVQTLKRPAESIVRKRGDDVRERVLLAALECFGSFGFEGTSTRAVAERAEVTHTLVLYHFQSKDNLWIATMENALRPYLSKIVESLDGSRQAPAREGLKAFIEQFLHLSARQPQIHRILTTASNQGTERLEWIIDHFLRDHFTQVRELIRRGQAEGSVRQCDPARLYYLIIGAGGTPFTIATEYKMFTGRDVFSDVEIMRNIAFIYEIVFT
jgi:AcrR family transcriptional regulator